MSSGDRIGLTGDDFEGTAVRARGAGVVGDPTARAAVAPWAWGNRPGHDRPGHARRACSAPADGPAPRPSGRTPEELRGARGPAGADRSARGPYRRRRGGRI